MNSPVSQPERAVRASPPGVCELTQQQVSPGETPHHSAVAATVQGGCDQPRGALNRQASPLVASLIPVKALSDPRLKGLDIAFWTEVPVTDIFAKDAISSYLRSDHRIWDLFDADAFLSDLVSHKSEFCSSFLVNCLMAFASVSPPSFPRSLARNSVSPTSQQTYAVDYPSATSKGLQFEEAAGLLWQTDATRLDSETALTGLILLYLCFAARWESNNADDCLRQVFEMATRMKLFGVEDRISNFDMSLLKADRRSSMVHAAWGAFNTMW